MNVLLTTRCNKGCSFCFARDKNKTHHDMSMDNFIKLLDFIQNSAPVPFFKLLGGEPTQHPMFVAFVSEIIKRKLKFGLISNVLYDDPEINNVLTQAIEEGFLLSILINTAEVNIDEKREKLFKKNHNYFLDYYKKTNSFSLANSITFNRKKTCAEEMAYLKFIIDKYEIHSLRISLDFQGTNQKDEFFINNTEYGEKFLKTLQICAAKNIVVNGDCVIYPCMFKDEYVVRKKLPRLIEQINYGCSNNSIPFDISPDLKYFHCYPANGFSGKSLLDFNNYQEVMRDFAFRKNILMQMNGVTETCQKCKYYQDKTCFSLCLGCSQLTSPLLQPVV